MQSVLALAFLALANAAIIDPIYYKPEAKEIYPYMKYESNYPYMDYPEKYMGDAVFSSVADAVIASANPAVAPMSFAKTAMPWANIISGAAPAVSSAIPLEAAYAPALKSGLASAIPAVKSAAYHLVKADYPYFTAAPTSSYVEAASPIMSAEEMAARGLFPALSSAFPATAASLAAAEPALRAAGLVHAAAPATHFVAAPSAAAASGIPLFKSAAFPWGLVSNFAAPASVVSAAPSPISLVRAASPLLGAESAFAASPAVHAIHASPAFASASPAFISALAKSAPASFVTGLSGAESALSGFAPAGTPVSFLVKAISPASSLAGAESALTGFAPAATPVSYMVKAISPASALSGAESALSGFAPAATPISFLIKAISPASSLAGAESALAGFAPAATPVSYMVKAISPASGLSGAETAIAFAPAHAGHAHAFHPALKAAFPMTAASLAGDALTFARGVPTLSSADGALYAVPASAGYLADSPALKAWIK